MPPPLQKTLHILACDRELVRDDFKPFDLEIKDLKKVGVDAQRNIVVMQLHLVKKKRTPMIAKCLKTMQEKKVIKEAWCEASDDSTGAENVRYGFDTTKMELICRDETKKVAHVVFEPWSS